MFNFKNWLIGDLLKNTEDYREKVCINLIYDFFLSYFVLYLFSISVVVYLEAYLQVKILIITGFVKIALFILLKFSKQINLVTIVYCIIEFLIGVYFILYLNDIHIIVWTWMLIPVLLSNFVLGKKWFKFFLISLLSVVLIFTYLQQHNISFNIDYDKDILDGATPILMFPSLFLLYRLFSKYNILQTKASELVLTQKEELSESNTIKDNILSVVAHDLKSPIASIQGLTFLIETEIKKRYDLGKNDDLTLFTSKIKESCEYSSKLIFQLLEIERLRAGSIQLSFDKIDLRSIVNQCIVISKEQALLKEITLYNFSDNNPCIIQGDKTRIEQVINNLLNNAIKFSNNKSRIDITIFEERESSIIKVKDFGVGIPQDMQPHIFERFTKVKRSGTQGERPHGLGLSIVGEIVRLHHAKIWFKSKENEGTTFYVQFPHQINSI